MLCASDLIASVQTFDEVDAREVHGTAFDPLELGHAEADIIPSVRAAAGKTTHFFSIHAGRLDLGFKFFIGIGMESKNDLRFARKE